MKLQILIPQYKETDEIVKPLLDSIALQQNVDLNEVGAIIVNDGSDVHLTEDFLKGYPYGIQYYLEEHRGVSATRNACLDKATADYVMFCDADDMFFNMCGLYIVFREFDNGGFDALTSTFVEETKDPLTKQPIYINHQIDSTFVHGKFFRRQFLVDENIRWNPKLTIHEDSFFNCLAQKCAKEHKFCPTAFYLWKWRDDSVCRHDPKYILKTYPNMIESNTALVEELLKRGKEKDAQYFATFLIYDAYFTMNKKEWIDQENKEYRRTTEARFKKYYDHFSYLHDAVDEKEKAQVIMGLKNRMYQEGLLMESITFDEWIKNVVSTY